MTKENNVIKTALVKKEKDLPSTSSYNCSSLNYEVDIVEKYTRNSANIKKRKYIKR